MYIFTSQKFLSENGTRWNATKQKPRTYYESLNGAGAQTESNKWPQSNKLNTFCNQTTCENNILNVFECQQKMMILFNVDNGFHFPKKLLTTTVWRDESDEMCGLNISRTLKKVIFKLVNIKANNFDVTRNFSTFSALRKSRTWCWRTSMFTEYVSKNDFLANMTFWLFFVNV